MFVNIVGGSLAELLTQRHGQGRYFSEAELTQLLLQIAQGLKYIHSQNLVHLDIKLGKNKSTYDISKVEKGTL